jgi:penicillin amidase
MSVIEQSILPRWAGRLLGPVVRLLARRSLPRTRGRLEVPGLSAPVQVLRDRWGIPHVYAASATDLFFAQGFVHAQERMFEMEMARRVSSGRLAEAFGAIALGTDRLARTLGFLRLAEREWAGMDGEPRATLEAYAAGVNAFLASGGSAPGVEFDLLRFSPRPWSPVDSLAFGRFQAWHLSHSWAAELTRARLIEKIGEARASELEVPYPETQPCILAGGIDPARLTLSDAMRAGLANPHTVPPHAGGVGSNSWVLARQRTTSGGAILANDMHLELKIPGVWFLAHLHAADGSFHATGCSIPGMPGIIVGHNERIAWGATLGFADQQDLVVERLRPGSPPSYEWRGEWVACEVHAEAIEVKGYDRPHVEEVIVTRHGPLVGGVLPDLPRALVATGSAEGAAAPSGRAPDEGSMQGLALQSVALRSPSALGGFLALAQARDWDSFGEAVRKIASPDLNLTYADVDGNIGYRLSGEIPIRERGQGRVPVPGWSGDHEWARMIPFDEMPHALNPERGFLVTANNRIVDATYPHFLSSSWMNGYRADRITRRILETPAMGLAECRELQMDVRSLAGEELVARLAGFEASGPDARLALDLLRRWDRVLAADSAGGAVFAVLSDRLVRELIERPLGPELALDVLGVGPNPVLCPMTELMGRMNVALVHMLGDPSSSWVAEAGGREALLERCLEQTARFLRERLGADPGAWQWGSLHRVHWQHAFTRHPLLSGMFDRGPFPIGGDTDTVHQTAYLPQAPYDNLSFSPSYRQVIDLADFSRSRVIIPPGQSGHLASPHYDDLIEPWRAGDLLPMLWERVDVEAAAVDRLEIVPGAA